MPEVVSVNTGAVDWPDVDAAAATVRGMQLKLHRWAGADGSRRFGDLFNLVYEPAFLVYAWKRVAGNVGARTPGIDRATVATIETRIGVEAFLGQIRDALKSGVFAPVEVRRVMIPKASGKLRALGIPTVADRVVQAALKAVLEPIFEADFMPCSYGFRPSRRAHDAIAEIHHLSTGTRKYHWVLEADIRACFDQIDHTALMVRLRRRIKDKRVGALVKAFLKAGVMTTAGHREETPAGTPQGGILSPLLANIALSALDEHFTRAWQQEMGTPGQRAARKRSGLGNWRLIRYADDFVVMVSGERHHAEALRAEAAEVLAPLGLVLAVEKTRVVHIDEGFDFLGFHIRRMRKRGTQKHYVYTMPSKKAVASIKAKVKDRTRGRTLHRELRWLLVSLNRVLQGWANYFRHGVSSKVFNVVDSHAWRCVVGWIFRKHSRLSWRQIRRRFCRPGTWKPCCDGVELRGASSIAITRYRYRGSSIPTPWTPQPAAATRG
jgi:RNA-directed DNA polymerase